MGSGRWEPDDWAAYRSTTVGKSTHDIYKTTHATAKTVLKETGLNPLGVKLRESRDSDLNPQSTPIIVGIDVTGSMGRLAQVIATDGLGVIFKEILERKPVTDPHLMFMAIGDANCDSYPLQVSQFEADSRIIPQLANIFVEGGGGGNRFESYNLPWYFAAMHTSIDSLEKRNKKGYLFTIGDEQAPGDLTPAQIKKFIGDDVVGTQTTEQVLRAAQKMYNVFHIIVQEQGHGSEPETMRSWKDLLGQHVIPLSDHRKLAEVIVSAIQVVEGDSKEKVTKSWSKETSLVVAKAVKDLVPIKGQETGVKRFR